MSNNTIYIDDESDELIFLTTLLSLTLIGLIAEINRKHIINLVKHKIHGLYSC